MELIVAMASWFMIVQCFYLRATPHNSARADFEKNQVLILLFGKKQKCFLLLVA